MIWDEVDPMRKEWVWANLLVTLEVVDKGIIEAKELGLPYREAHLKYDREVMLIALRLLGWQERKANIIRAEARKLAGLEEEP